MPKKQESMKNVMEKLSALCQHLTEDQKRQLERSIILQEYKKNEIIYHEGDTPQHLLCLLRGKVKVFKDGVGGRAQTMRLYKPVEYFGYRAYITGENIHCTAAAFETSFIAKIPLDLLVSFIRSNNELAWFFIQSLAKLLGMSDERTVSLTQKHIRGRLAESLLYLRDSYGLEEDGCTLSIYLSREDLANLSNMTTSNAIRTLSAFAAEHLVAIDGKKIKLINEAELEKISRMG
ncbi:MAG: Crp/Fnr family transcriptional regulator [Bacteroidaceae bacterium]|nr:Crp/Fnr family transcriptional regulator [Bacteroidaceae bacterium]